MSLINRLVLHHSGGAYAPGPADLRAYHRITDGEGETVDGVFPIKANTGRLWSGTYAAHTLNLNTGSIGLAMACMGGGQWSNPRACKFFPRPAQVDAFLREAARLCVLYSIKVERETCLTHAEVQTTLGIKQKNKWDFDYDPMAQHDSRDPIYIGDELRWEIRAYMEGLDVEPMRQVAPDRPSLRRGAAGAPVRHLQGLLGIKPADGDFGPATDSAVRAFQARHSLRPDGVVGPLTWAALDPKGT